MTRDCSLLAAAVPILAVLLLQGCSTSTHRISAPIPEPTPVRKELATEVESEQVQAIVDLGRRLLGSPYRWGGTDPSGFDCSGLTRFVLATAGVDLPRTTSDQARSGRWIAPDELRRGDLVFFGSQRAKPLHVGLVVSHARQPLTMIHASTTKGVISTEIVSNPFWLPRLIFGRRVLNP